MSDDDCQTATGSASTLQEPTMTNAAMDPMDVSLMHFRAKLREADAAFDAGKLDRLRDAFVELKAAAAALGVSTHPSFHAKELPRGVIVAAGKKALVTCQFHMREHSATTWHALAPGDDPPLLGISREATTAEVEASAGPTHDGRCEWFRAAK